MTKAKIILINVLVWLASLLDGDCTVAVTVTIFSLLEIFTRKNKRRVKYE